MQAKMCNKLHEVESKITHSEQRAFIPPINWEDTTGDVAVSPMPHPICGLGFYFAEFAAQNQVNWKTNRHLSCSPIDPGAPYPFKNKSPSLDLKS